MERETKTYVLKRPVEEALPRKLSIDYAAALNSQQIGGCDCEGWPFVGHRRRRQREDPHAHLSRRLFDRFGCRSGEYSAPDLYAQVGAGDGGSSRRADWFPQRTGLRRDVSLGCQYAASSLWAAIGLEPGFTILDRSDAEDLIALIRAQLGLNEKDKRFPRKATIAEMFSKSENTLRPLDEIVVEEFDHFSDHLDDLGKLQRAYETAKRQKQLVDYDDLLVLLRRLLMQDEAVRRSIASLYRYILVDEYQDTNRLAGGYHQAPGGDPPERDGRRRRLAIDLWVPRRDVQEHHGIPDAVSRRHDLQA